MGRLHLALLLGLVMVVIGALLPRAAAAAGWVYFGGWYDEEIGRIGTDGQDPVRGLIVSDDAIPQAMTVSGEYLYWEQNSYPVEIGRARLDGSEVQPRFIVAGGGQANAPGLSVSGGRIYWSETRNPSGEGPSYLSSANLDGSGLLARQVSLGPDAADSVAVAGEWVYFITTHYSRGIDHYGVVRTRVDGRGASRKIAFNRPLVSATLVLAGSHAFWVESEDGKTFIARASLDGSNINTHFRRVPQKGCHTHSEMHGGAISGRFYFLGCESGGIDRVALTGHRGLRQLRTHARTDGGPILAATP
jgi:hypothetical protein